MRRGDGGLWRTNEEEHEGGGEEIRVEEKKDEVEQQVEEEVEEYE